MECFFLKQRPYMAESYGRVSSYFQSYRISFNKKPQRLFKVEAVRWGAYWRALKEGGDFFKVREIILMKFQNFVIFSF